MVVGADALETVYDNLAASRVNVIEVRLTRDPSADEQPSRLIVANWDLERAAMILGESLELGELYAVRPATFLLFVAKSHNFDLLFERQTRAESIPEPRCWVARSDVREFDKIVESLFPFRLRGGA